MTETPARRDVAPSSDELLEANASYATAFPGSMPGPPAARVAIVACMDARLQPAAALGLGVGEAHVIRNAGGLITDDVLRSLAISQRALGTTTVVVVHHTRCGMQGFDDAEFRAQLGGETGEVPTWDVPGFDDPFAQIRESVGAVRSCVWLPHRDDVRGFVFDVDSGVMTAVDA